MLEIYLAFFFCFLTGLFAAKISPNLKNPHCYMLDGALAFAAGLIQILILIFGVRFLTPPVYHWVVDVLPPSYYPETQVLAAKGISFIATLVPVFICSMALSWISFLFFSMFFKATPKNIQNVEAGKNKTD